MPWLTDLASIAAEASRVGGTTILAADRRPTAIEKTAGDYVTEVDTASERAITELLARRHARHPGRRRGAWWRPRRSRYWLVDPLDGTTNFVHGFPIGRRIGSPRGGRPTDRRQPSTPRSSGDVPSAPADTGARLERPGSPAEPLRGLASDRRNRRSSAPGSRSGTRRSCPALPPDHGGSAQPTSRTSVVPARRPSTSPWVASGVFDGFFELALSPWDVAAGGLLIEEAGGLVTDWDGGPDYLTRRHPGRPTGRPRRTPNPRPQPQPPDPTKRAGGLGLLLRNRHRPAEHLLGLLAREPHERGLSGSAPPRPRAISRWRASQYSGIASGLIRTWTLRYRGHAGAGRDQLADDHVLLQAEQRVATWRRSPRR